MSRLSGRLCAIGALASAFWAPPAPAQGAGGAGPDSIPGTSWTVGDWKILDQKIQWAASRRLDTLELGEAVAAMGSTFVGATYRPATLEAPGPERLIINLRELDCVTFVENVLALVRFVRLDGAALLADPPAARARYERYLRDLRYRGGTIDGYPSRLHYFSEWLAENERGGRIRQITEQLGGTKDTEPIDFMSTHRTAYRQLEEPGVFDAIRSMEHRLNRALPRRYIPENRIAAVAGRIRNGDVIAATSTVGGLDVAHTGFALWREGKLHLLHAPLVGRSVEISEQPLAERILVIHSQDGIMVARPIEAR
jgi:hypothetical protein